MKTYESATLVELGNAGDLVLGDDGDGLDFITGQPCQEDPTFLDVNE